MKTPSARFGTRSRFFWIEIGLLVVLVGVGAFVWLRRVPSGDALKKASLADLGRINREHPNTQKVLFYLGQRQEAAGTLAASYDSYTHAADLNPDDIPCWLAAARVAGQLNGDSGEMNILSAVVQRQPRSAAVHLALGQFYSRHQAHERARSEALTAAQLDPHLAEAWYVAGVSSAMLGATTEAENSLKRAMAEGKGEWRYGIMLANVLAQERCYTEAIQYAEQAAAQAPKEAVPYLTLGKLQLAQAKSHSEIEAALQNLEKSRLLQPGVPTVYLLLGRAFGAEGQWADALTAVKRAEEIAPNDPHTLFELARVYRQLGRTPEAERVTQRYRQVRIGGTPAV